MASSARLQWILQCLDDGMHVSMHATYNVDNGTEKFKFTICKDVFGSKRLARRCLRSMVCALSKEIVEMVVVDRGHTHSSGLSVVEVFVKRGDDSHNDHNGDFDTEGKANEQHMAQADAEGMPTALVVHMPVAKPLPRPGRGPLGSRALASSSTTARPVVMPPSLDFVEGVKGIGKGVEDGVAGEDDFVRGEDDDLWGEEVAMQGEDDLMAGGEDFVKGADVVVEGKDEFVKDEQDIVIGEDDHVKGEEDGACGDEVVVKGGFVLGGETFVKGKNDFVQDAQDVVMGEEDFMRGEEDDVWHDEVVVVGEGDLMEDGEDSVKGADVGVEGKGDFVKDGQDVVKGEDDSVKGEEDVMKGEDDLRASGQDVVKGEDIFVKGEEDIAKVVDDFLKGVEDFVEGEADFATGEKDVGKDEQDVESGADDFGKGTDDFMKGEQDVVKDEDDFGKVARPPARRSWADLFHDDHDVTQAEAADPQGVATHRVRGRRGRVGGQRAGGRGQRAVVRGTARASASATSSPTSAIPAGTGPLHDDRVFTGTIKSFVSQEGWGFIRCEETYRIFGKDVFLLRSTSGMKAADTVWLAKGFRVVFRIKAHPGHEEKPYAVDVKFVDY